MITLDCPANIELLLWCHTLPEPHPTYNSGHHIGALKELLEAGAIEPDANGKKNVYRTTPLGAAWVRALCLTPRPRQVFVDTAGVILE